MMPRTNFFSSGVCGAQPTKVSTKAWLAASFCIDSCSASVSVVSDAEPPNSRTLRRWKRSSLRPCLDSISLVKLSSFWLALTKLRISRTCSRRSPPVLYRMWNFSRLRLRRHARRKQLHLTNRLQTESRRAYRDVKMNLRYLARFSLIRTSMTSALLNLWSGFVSRLFSKSSACLITVSSGPSVSDRLFLILLAVFAADFTTCF